MTPLAWLVILLGVVLVQRVVELWVAKKNETWILARGGIEFSPEHYKWIVLLHVLWLFAWPAEAYLLGPTLSPGYHWLLAGLMLAQILRYGALFSLGRYWNTRIIVVPGEQAVTRGLYRWIPHPNYAAVALELALFPLFFCAYYTATLCTLLNAAILLGVRIPAENRALAQLKKE